MNPETVPARKGEQLNAIALRDFLEAGLAASGELDIRQFPAGSSNLTYLISIDGSEYVLRRPPFGNTVKTAHDMRREFEVLSKLAAVYAPAPKPLLFCSDESVIGSEFYLMERRYGLIIRGTAPGALATKSEPPASAGGRAPADESVSGSATDSMITFRPPAYAGGSDKSDLRRRVCESFIRNLAELHALDYKAAGLETLGHPEGYARRQVEGWTKRYFDAKTDEHPELESAIAWLNANIPAESGASLVHNDYKFDNVMLDPEDLTKITAVLDWEMVTIGDPLMDLGTTLGYWMSRDAGEEMLSMPFNPRVLMENVTRRELAEMYADASGRDISNILYYYIFGTFKIAVIAQQIYARYVKGLTQDRRFEHFGKFVAALGRIATDSVRTGKI
jgi:aminoglycoside phosphotransferase (APT) family kinase protein